MALIFSCACGKRLKAGDNLAGRKAKCPFCGQETAIPETQVRSSLVGLPAIRWLLPTFLGMFLLLSIFLLFIGVPVCGPSQSEALVPGQMTSGADSPPLPAIINTSENRAAMPRMPPTTPMAEETKPVPPQSEEPREPDSTPAVATQMNDLHSRGIRSAPAEVEIIKADYMWALGIREETTPYERIKMIAADVLRQIKAHPEGFDPRGYLGASGFINVQEQDALLTIAVAMSSGLVDKLEAIDRTPQPPGVIPWNGWEQRREPDSTPAVPTQTRKEGHIVAEELRIPADVSYRTVKDVLDSPSRPYKRSVFVVLNKKVSLDVLQAITMEVKARENPQVERHIVRFWLPGWDIEEEGCWGLTDDLPGLTINTSILGLTQEEEDSFRREPIPPGLELVGRWLYDRQFGTCYSIFRENGKYFLGLGHVGGFKTEIEEATTSNGHDFKVRNGTDHYLVDFEGNLEIRNFEGKLLATPEKIR
ncbi:MAG: hypothetical protein ACLP7Q_27070 [Isosphaeraceae bacterium]